MLCSRFSLFPFQKRNGKGWNILCGLLLLSCFHGCASVPVTGRSQLMMLSKQEEVKLGDTAANAFTAQMVKQGKVIRTNSSEERHQDLHRLVRRIYSRILEACGWQNEYKWQYLIVDDPKVINAAMFPGGKMVVYTGIIHFAKSEDELATVIAHEIAHGIARHGAERYSQHLAVNLAATVLEATLANSKNYPLYMAAFGLGAQFGVLLPYSRLHENEADYIGFLAMAKAGYHPNAAIQFWERMEKEARFKSIEFFSTHPSYETRLTRLREALPLAMEYRNNPSKPLNLQMRK